MSIIQQLGINESALYQFLIFGFAFISLWAFAFGPYTKALQAREARTQGGEDVAAELHRQASELRKQYESKAKQVGGEVKTIFDSYRDEANKEYSEIVAKARLESQKLIEETRAKVSLEVVEAETRLKDQVPEVVAAINSKLLSR